MTITPEEMKALTVGKSVIVKNDGDGADKWRGVIKTVYKSGRLCILFPTGEFRSLSKSQVELA